jgi:peptidoglycan/LPS O-acetylase OafA/YrhL
VLISHGFFFTNRVNGLGRIGVNLFFFISGILVYRSLHREEGRGWWQLAKSFWWRRLRRLYPALIAYAIAMIIPVWLLQTLPNLAPHSEFGRYLRTLPFALTYSINYLPDGAFALGHLWSLSCEMQFYCLAPLIFLLAGSNGRRRMLVFGGVALALAGIGLILPLSGSRYQDVRYHFEVAAWPMAFGLFCEFTKLWFVRVRPGLVRFVLGFGAAILAVIVILILFGVDTKLFVIAAGAMLLFPCLLSYLFGLTFPGMIGRCLSWCGERTYSIYLWQEPFTICGYLPPMLQPVGAAVSVLVGAWWFRVFEWPFLSVTRASHVSAPAHSLKQVKHHA